MFKDIKSKYNISIILAAITFIFLYNVGMIQEPTTQMTSNEKPVFFNRIPTSVKKIRQHINIDIDYEKLPARNEIRLIGKVNTAHLKSETVDYKWTLINNLKHKKGTVEGKLNLRDTNEITLDVAIKDMNKKINVRLEASVQGQKVKIGSVQSFTYDPTNEDIVETEQMKAQGKASSQTLSKEEYLKEQLNAPRKLSHQQ